MYFVGDVDVEEVYFVVGGEDFVCWVEEYVGVVVVCCFFRGFVEGVE